MKLTYLISIMTLAVIMGVTATSAAAYTTDLIAAQNIDAGDVTVWNDADHLYVKYETSGDWCLKETHLAVADSKDGIPHTKKGNPIPGQFEYSNYHDCVTEYTYTIEMEDCENVVVAAHAVVELPELSHIEQHSFCILSDDQTKYYNGLAYVPSVLAWVHPSWNSGLSIKLNNDGASWIWESYRVLHPVEGDIVDFQRSFNVVGTPTSGTLYITTDNGYEASLNGENIGSAQLGAGWRASDLTQPFVDTANWQSVETWIITSKLHTGVNVLDVAAANEYMGPKDGQSDGTIYSNPAGLIYKLCVDSEEKIIDRPSRNETAWGNGARFVRSEWAMHFNYQCTL